MIGYIFLVVSAITTILICTKKLSAIEKLEDRVVLTTTQTVDYIWYLVIMGIMFLVAMNGIFEVLFRVYGN